MMSLPRMAGRIFPKIFKRSTTSAAASTVDLKDARPFEEIPGPRGKYNIPVIGTLFLFNPFTKKDHENMQGMFDKLMEKHGSLVRVRLGEWSVLVEDPTDMEIVFRNEGKYPKRKKMVIGQLFRDKKGVPESLASLQGEEWHEFRSPLNALMMRTNSAHCYLPVQNEVADDLIAHLRKPISPKELIDIFYRYSCESISAVCFNERLGYLDPEVETQPEILNDIAKVVDAFTKSLRMPPFFLKYFPSKVKTTFFESGFRLFKTTTGYYEKAVKQHQTDGRPNQEKHNFMLSLIASKKLTPEKMSAVALSLFIAGTDSTARAIQMILYQLARNPDKQEKLSEEILTLIGRSGPLTEEAVRSMRYLPACLKESFRLIYPTVVGTQRILPTDIVLQGYRIPAGTLIFTMNQRTVKNPKYFPNPDSFIPERWLRDADRKRIHEVPSTALLPFGFGKRMCIGKRFAEQEIFLAVSKILQNFSVSLAPGQKEPQIIYTPFAGPKEPIEFIFTDRKH